MATKPIVSRLKLNGHNFEALCLPHKVREFREGKCKFEDCCADTDNVYKNATKGERWALKELEANFETNNVSDILKRIIEKGTAQITTDEFREDIEKKRREIIHYIASKYVDGKTSKPHPVTRIESALDSIKGLSIDPKREASTQVNELLRKIIDTGLSLKKLEIEGTVTCPHSVQSAVQGLFSKLAISVNGTNHNATGVVFEIGFNPAEMDNLNKELNRVAKGEAVFDIVNAPTVSAPKEEGAKVEGKKGKKGGKN